MNGGEDDNKQEQAKPADPTTHTLIIFYDKAKGNKPLLKAIPRTLLLRATSVLYFCALAIASISTCA